MMARPKYRYYLCRYTLKNKNNLEVNILNYGGIVKNVFTPDKDGKLLDIALGYDSLEGKSWFCIATGMVFPNVQCFHLTQFIPVMFLTSPFDDSY